MYFGNGSQTKHSALLHAICRSNLIWKGNGKLHFPKSSTHPCTRTLKKETMFFDTNLSTSTEINYLEATLHPSIKESAETRNMLNRGRLSQANNCNPVIVG